MQNKKLYYGIILAVVFLFFIYGCANKPSKIACTLEAKLCPDGSAVGRTGPNCEFAPCPGEVANYIEPEDPSKIGLTSYPNLPLSSELLTPIPIKYLVERRSALNEKVVTVKGIIIGNWLDESKCPPNAELLCPQNRIFLADANTEDRNQLYDLDVVVEENAKAEDYQIGETITIKVLVYGDKTSVHAVKTD